MGFSEKAIVEQGRIVANDTPTGRKLLSTFG